MTKLFLLVVYFEIDNSHLKRKFIEKIISNSFLELEIYFFKKIGGEPGFWNRLPSSSSSSSSSSVWYLERPWVLQIPVWEWFLSWGIAINKVWHSAPKKKKKNTIVQIYYIPLIIQWRIDYWETLKQMDGSDLTSQYYASHASATALMSKLYVYGDFSLFLFRFA